MVTRRTTPKAPGVASVGDVPVTRAMLHGVRDELRALGDQTNARLDETNARLDQVDARFAQVDARFARVDARFAQVDARFAQVDARFDQLEARIDGARAAVIAEVHRVGTLVEEQEARNRVVIESVQGHNARFERLEAGIEENRRMFREIMDLLQRRTPG